MEWNNGLFPIYFLFLFEPPTNRFRIDTMGSSEDALYFQTRYNGYSGGRYRRYPLLGRMSKRYLMR